jgi:hypothetical protein
MPPFFLFNKVKLWLIERGLSFIQVFDTAAMLIMMYWLGLPTAPDFIFKDTERMGNCK